MTALAAARQRYERLAQPLFLPLALLIFTASGFAGLIYESVWSHYLRLFLGHAAYAQTLVLAIFMGGMALGAWAASRWSPRWRDLLLAYAVIEAVIGVISLVFHPVFVAATAFALNHAIPALGSPGAVHAFKWTLAALLILPQSVLLGMTFPLMTGGVLRLRPQQSGYAIAMLYFTNSLGAGIGVLASGFYLIATVGLPGTLAAAACINLAVAAAVMFLPRRAPADATEPPRPAADAVAQLRLLLTVAALTGLSSFLYEVGWIRMLALVLGSSTHAFEVMLSAFILGIAFGGLWVRRRIDAARDTVRLLGVVQVIMGIAALATLPVYGSSFELMRSALGILTPTESGYVAFNFVSHALALAVMFPAAFCAGMTLPLITASLLRRGAGERAIGQVYAANTAGAIAGVLLAVHVGFPLLGLKGLITAGAAIDLALGVWLLAPARRLAGFAAAASLAAVAFALFVVRLDAHHMASGVYRHGHLIADAQAVKFQLDGKTATVSVTGDRELLSLRTNGKVDGSVRIDAGTSTDEITMTFLGALPLFLAPEARRVANIGFGTGITTHVVLASPRVETVDTVEIEPLIVRAAAHFRRFNWRALDDPRSHVHYDDAKTYFSAQQKTYDVILSEPSNPWVSGVASLFSTEFYRDVRRYLRDGGLFFQWVQLYEMTPPLLATIVKALDAHFTDYEFWLSNDGDMVIVAAHNGRVPRPDAAALRYPELRAELERFRIRNLDDLYLHRLGGREALGPYFASFGVEPNSDFFPVLELRAPQARFMHTNAGEVVRLVEGAYAMVKLFDREPGRPDPARLTEGDRPWWQRGAWARQAINVQRYLSTGKEGYIESVSPEYAADLMLMRAALVDCRVRMPPGALRHQFVNLSRYVSAHLLPVQAAELWNDFGRRCAARLSSRDRRWLQLHGAIAAGEPWGMVRTAQWLLESEPDLKDGLLAQVLAAYMAGKILLEDRPAALRAQIKYGSRVGAARRDWDPVFRFLIGQADYGAANPRPSADKNGHSKPRAAKPASDFLNENRAFRRIRRAGTPVA